MIRWLKNFLMFLWNKWYDYIDTYYLTPPKDEDLEWQETNLKIPAGETQVMFDVSGFLAWEWANEVILFKGVPTCTNQKEKLYVSMLKS